MRLGGFLVPRGVVLNHIVPHVNAISLGRLSQVSTQWWELSQLDQYWRFVRRQCVESVPFWETKLFAACKTTRECLWQYVFRLRFPEMILGMFPLENPDENVYIAYDSTSPLPETSPAVYAILGIGLIASQNKNRFHIRLIYNSNSHSLIITNAVEHLTVIIDCYDIRMKAKGLFTTVPEDIIFTMLFH